MSECFLLGPGCGCDLREFVQFLLRADIFKNTGEIFFCPGL